VIHYVSGEPYEGNGKRAQAVFNPATGAVARQVRLGTAEDVDAAVASAVAAFPKWADTPPFAERG
jgi:malonate-semialdehyde dehydrogenase (acetylating)/methylmalonate-semialdehyde dehydrogenase